MTFTPPYMRRLQRKFPQPEEKKEAPVEKSEAKAEADEVVDPGPSLEEKLAEWEADSSSEPAGTDQDEEESSTEESDSEEEEKEEELVSFSESWLKQDLYELAVGLDLEVTTNDLKAEIVDTLRESDKTVEVDSE